MSWYNDERSFKVNKSVWPEDEVLRGCQAMQDLKSVVFPARTLPITPRELLLVLTIISDALGGGQNVALIPHEFSLFLFSFRCDFEKEETLVLHPFGLHFSEEDESLPDNSHAIVEYALTTKREESELWDLRQYNLRNLTCKFTVDSDRHVAIYGLPESLLNRSVASQEKHELGVGERGFDIVQTELEVGGVLTLRNAPERGLLSLSSELRNFEGRSLTANEMIMIFNGSTIRMLIGPNLVSGSGAFITGNLSGMTTISLGSLKDRMERAEVREDIRDGLAKLVMQFEAQQNRLKWKPVLIDMESRSIVFLRLKGNTGYWTPHQKKIEPTWSEENGEWQASGVFSEARDYLGDSEGEFEIETLKVSEELLSFTACGWPP